MTDYSEKLKSLKVVSVESNTSNVKKALEALNGFCTKEDLLGVPQSSLFELFDQYCEENGIELLPRNAIGRAIRLKYAVSSKVIRIGKKTVKVYIDE